MSGARVGRARSVKAWDAILTATRDELATRGYDRMSIDRIATAAGVGKQTVYRWYPSKSALVAECILRGYLMPLSLPVTNSSDCRRDISEWLSAFVAESHRPLAADLLRAGTAAAAEDIEIAARYRTVMAATEEGLVARLTSGIDDGQLPPATPAAAVAEMLVGAMVYRVLARQELTPAFAEELVQVVFGDAQPKDGDTGVRSHR